ncbi:MAG: 30S ribosomal protein S7 [Bacilli bacterium]
MPRKGTVPKRVVLPDPIYDSVVITKLVNSFMVDGKRGKAQKIIYGALEKIESNTGNPAMDVFNQALENIMPIMEVRSRRIGGANYQIPVEVDDKRRQALGLRWLVTYSRLRKDRSEKTMVDKLAGELMDAANETGGAVKKREDVHRMAEANKAFAHYRW